MIPENSTEPTMEVAEAAALLGWTPSWFRRKRAQLVHDDGMPFTLPGGRYCRASFMRWLETYSDRKRAAGTATVAAVRISFDRDRLTALYGGAAA